MNEIEAVTYAESREAFFAGALRKAERQLDWAVKHNPDCYVCAEKGEAVAYYQDALTALREKAEREKGCEYCNTRFGIATHHINEAGLQAGTKRNAKYCPECSRRLEVEP